MKATFLVGVFGFTLSLGALVVSAFVFGLPHYRALFAWWSAQQLSDAAPAVASAPAPAPSARIGWNLKDIRFSYPQSSQPAVSSLVLRIEPGTTMTYFRPDSGSYWQRQPGKPVQTPPWVSQ